MSHGVDKCQVPIHRQLASEVVLCVCVCVCVCVCIYTHTHTHIYIYIYICICPVACYSAVKKKRTKYTTVGRHVRKLSIELPHDPAIPLLGIYPGKAFIENDTCTPCVPCSTVRNSRDSETSSMSNAR